MDVYIYFNNLLGVIWRSNTLYYLTLLMYFHSLGLCVCLFPLHVYYAPGSWTTFYLKIFSINLFFLILDSLKKFHYIFCDQRKTCLLFFCKIMPKSFSCYRWEGIHYNNLSQKINGNFSMKMILNHNIPDFMLESMLINWNIKETEKKYLLWNDWSSVEVIL